MIYIKKVGMQFKVFSLYLFFSFFKFISFLSTFLCKFMYQNPKNKKGYFL